MNFINDPYFPPFPFYVRALISEDVEMADAQSVKGELLLLLC